MWMACTLEAVALTNLPNCPSSSMLYLLSRIIDPHS